MNYTRQHCFSCLKQMNDSILLTIINLKNFNCIGSHFCSDEDAY